MTSATRAIAVGAVAFIAAVVTLPFARYPSLIGADWITYRTGLADVLDGRPLYRPELLLGPYDYLSSAFANAFNMPPWFLPATVPIVFLPDSVQRPVWVLMVAAILVVAFGLVLPRTDRVIWAGLAACGSFVWMAVAWGNASAVVGLGIALWATGLRRRSTSMRVVGLVLASVKIVPVLPLAIYEIQTRHWRQLVVSGVVVSSMVALLTMATGTNVLLAFGIAFANIRQVSDTNLAPSSFLAQVMPGVDTVLLVRVVSLAGLAWLALRPASLYRVAAMELAVCGLVLNVYSFWLLHPLIAAFAAVRAEEETAATGDESPSPALSSTT